MNAIRTLAVALTVAVLSAPSAGLAAEAVESAGVTQASDVAETTSGYYVPVYVPTCRSVQICDHDYYGNFFCSWRTFCG